MTIIYGGSMGFPHGGGARSHAAPDSLADATAKFRHLVKNDVAVLSQYLHIKGMHVVESSTTFGEEGASSTSILFRPDWERIGYELVVEGHYAGNYAWQAETATLNAVEFPSTATVVTNGLLRGFLSLGHAYPGITEFKDSVTVLASHKIGLQRLISPSLSREPYAGTAHSELAEATDMQGTTEVMPAHAYFRAVYRQLHRELDAKKKAAQKAAAGLSR